MRVVYTVDIGKDLIEKIVFLAEDGTKNNELGVLEFTYLEELDNLSGEFTAPAEIKLPKAKRRDAMGMLWLIKLAQGTFEQ